MLEFCCSKHTHSDYSVHLVHLIVLSTRNLARREDRSARGVVPGSWSVSSTLVFVSRAFLPSVLRAKGAVVGGIRRDVC